MKRWWWTVLVPFMVVACGDEGPTGVGAGLLPPDAIRTFEILIGPEQYLAFDTAFGLYSEPQDADFVIVANQFEGALNARGLARFNFPPSIAVTDTLGVGRLDTVPNWIGGTIRMQVDTLRSQGQPVRLAVYRTVQPWAASATWTLLRDDPGQQQPWATPGGGLGVLVDTLTVPVGRDSIAFRVDSATVAAWADTASASRGAIFVMETQGGRVRMTLPVLELQARSTHRPDTVYTALASAPTHTFIFTPEQPTISPAPRVGGTPAWRTIMHLRPRLDTLSFACPGVPNCRFRLSEANINFAALRLQPVPPPPGLRPEADLTLAAYLLLPSAQIPLQRSPLGDVTGVANVPATRFTAPDAPVVEMPITELFRVVATPPAARQGDFVPTHLALVQVDTRSFGFATFQALPTLRLVVSITQEMQLP